MAAKEPTEERRQAELSLLLSQAQRHALDRAGVPCPPLRIPVTEEQRDFWRRFAMEVEFLPEEDLEDPELLEAIAEEWTAAATVGEALRLLSPRAGEAATAWVLGVADSEYRSGAEELERRVAQLAFGEDTDEASATSLHLRLRVIFCGPEVPSCAVGIRRRGQCLFQHRKGLWQDQPEQADLVVALNAGTAVREYRREWQAALERWANGPKAPAFFTGYVLPEAEETSQQLAALGASVAIGACRSAALRGFDRVELGVTPCSFPGKENYAFCAAWPAGGHQVPLPRQPPAWPILAAEPS
ncbi:unnamed protein product [Effrenium voratum]|nr:unnamed protein product [Effrenium voratum]